VIDVIGREMTMKKVEDVKARIKEIEKIWDEEEKKKEEGGSTNVETDKEKKRAKKELRVEGKKGNE
jgi:hypothetical protein